MNTGNRPEFCSVRANKTTGRGWLLRILVACAITIALPGCLYDRLLEVKAQACEFDKNFELQFDDTLAIHLKNPVFLERDIILILGAEPTSRLETGERLLLSYEIEEALAEPDRNRDLQIDFEFLPTGGQFRLNSILLDSNFDLVFNSGYLDRTTMMESARRACETALGPGMASFELDMGELALDWLPTKKEILQRVGPPHSVAESRNSWTYRYRLKGSQNGGDARFTVRFDNRDEMPVQLVSQYSRYRSMADLEAGTISMDIDLFR